MTKAEANRAVAGAMAVTFGIGFVNSILKRREFPSMRFFIGSGIAYVGLAGIAEISPEVAKGLAIAVVATALLGEGGGVLSYLTAKGELDTTAPKAPGPVGYATPSARGPRGEPLAQSATDRPEPKPALILDPLPHIPGISLN